MENILEKEEKEEVESIKFFIILLSGFLVPVFLIPLVKVTGHSEIAEEIAKGIVIFFIARNYLKPKKGLFLAIFFGLTFSLTETFFYLFGIFQNGNDAIFIDRLIFASSMHILTAAIVFCFIKINKFLFFLAVPVAITLHIFFNHCLVIK